MYPNNVTRKGLNPASGGTGTERATWREPMRRLTRKPVGQGLLVKHGSLVDASLVEAQTRL